MINHRDKPRQQYRHEPDIGGSSEGLLDCFFARRHSRSRRRSSESARRALHRLRARGRFERPSAQLAQVLATMTTEPLASPGLLVDIQLVTERLMMTLRGWSLVINIRSGSAGYIWLDHLLDSMVTFLQSTGT